MGSFIIFNKYNEDINNNIILLGFIVGLINGKLSRIHAFDCSFLQYYIVVLHIPYCEQFYHSNRNSSNVQEQCHCKVMPFFLKSL